MSNNAESFDWIIIHHLKIQGDDKRIDTPHMLITDVPSDVTIDDIEVALAAAGLVPMEAGIPWANYSLLPYVDQHLPREHRTWQQIKDDEGKGRRITFEMPLDLHQQIRACAAKAGRSMHAYIMDSVKMAIEKDDVADAALHTTAV